MPKWVECPFFRRERDQYAYCEMCRFRFPDKQARRDILFTYCSDPVKYQECMLYKTLQSYYERLYDKEDHTPTV